MIDADIHNVIIWFHEQGVQLHQAGRYEEALENFQHARNLSYEHLGEEHPEFAKILSSLSVVYSAMGQYTEAEPLCRQSLAILTRFQGEDGLEFARALNNLATVYDAMERYAEAEPLLCKALDIKRELLGENHPGFTTSLNNLATLYKAMGRYAEAEQLLCQAVEIIRRAQGEDNLEYATSVNNLAMLYVSRGRYIEAESLLCKAIEITDKIGGQNHPSVAAHMQNLAEVYYTRGKYAAAEPLYCQAMEIIKATLGEAHPYFLKLLQSLAELYRTTGRLTEAESFSHQAVEMSYRALGEEHQISLGNLNELAGIYQTMGRYEDAEQLFQKAIEICRDTQGENHLGFATGLNNLALLYEAMGKYTEGIMLLRQAIEIKRGLLGKNHPEVASSLNNLALLYEAMENYSTAEPLLLQAIEIRRRTLGSEHPHYAQSMHNLAWLYTLIRKYSKAEPLFQQALVIWQKTLGEDNSDFASGVNNFAILCDNVGDFKKAERLYRKSMNIRERVLGENHPDVGLSLRNLALLSFQKGDYNGAEALLRQSLRIVRISFGEEHKHFAENLRSIAVVCAATDRQTEALQYMERAINVDNRVLGQIFSFSSENHRLSYLKAHKGNLDMYLSLVFQHQSVSSVRTAFNVVLRRKAITVEALAVQRDAVLGDRYPELIQQFQELTALRMQIARKTLAGSGTESVDVHQQMLMEWNTRKDQLETELARQIPEMNLEERFRQVDPDTVARLLSEKTALVEFVRFDEFDFKAVPAQGESQWKPARYLAFVVLTGRPADVHLIDLGEAEPIDSLIAAFRDSVIQEGERKIGVIAKMTKTSAEEGGLQLKSMLFDPLLPALKGCTRVIIAPDGNLARLPFEILPFDDGRRLIDDYDISYLGAGRDILRFGQTSTRQPAPPLIVADPDFDLGRETEDRQEEQKQEVPTSLQPKKRFFARLFSRKKVESQTPIEQEPPQQVAQVAPEPSQIPPIHISSSRHSHEMDESHIHFEPLEGTRMEGKHIGSMLGIQPWFGGEALEARLKATRSPRLLHIATHGFFLEDQHRDLNKGMPGFGAMGFKSFAETGFVAGSGLENPLLLSGLALAGANSWLQGKHLPPEAEDGLLTAEDVTGLDLLDTDLVVLSACETGLGEVHFGEGVFGLRRSFVIAGAKTLVMSLWKVPDEQTQELMVDFYQRLLKGEGRAEALRNAQLALKAKYPHPFYWGAFICQGDPAPLQN